MKLIALAEFCPAFKAVAAADAPEEEKITRGKDLLAGLLQDDRFLVNALAAVAGSQTPEPFLPMDVNGVSLYRDPDRKFSLHLFIWEPYTPYPIHDHGSWGVVGCYRGKIEEKKWQVLERPDARTARLAVRQVGELTRGGTTFVQPLDAGLHSMKALDGKLALSVHAYGEAVRKGNLQLYHRSGRGSDRFDVYNAYPLYAYRRLLALEALAAVGTEQAEASVSEVLGDKAFKLAEEVRRFV